MDHCADHPSPSGIAGKQNRRSCVIPNQIGYPTFRLGVNTTIENKFLALGRRPQRYHFIIILQPLIRSWMVR
jgi:hypothetical protein